MNKFLLLLGALGAIPSFLATALPQERRLPEETCWNQTRKMLGKNEREDSVFPTKDDPSTLRVVYHFNPNSFPLVRANQAAGYIKDGLAQNSTLSELYIVGESLKFIARADILAGIRANPQMVSKLKRFSFLSPDMEEEDYISVLATLYEGRKEPMDLLALGDCVTDRVAKFLDRRQVRKYPPKHLKLRGKLTGNGFKSLIAFIKISKGLEDLELTIRMGSQGVPDEIKSPLMQAARNKNVSIKIVRLRSTDGKLQH